MAYFEQFQVRYLVREVYGMTPEEFGELLFIPAKRMRAYLYGVGDLTRDEEKRVQGAAMVMNSATFFEPARKRATKCTTDRDSHGSSNEEVRKEERRCRTPEEENAIDEIMIICGFDLGDFARSEQPICDFGCLSGYGDRDIIDRLVRKHMSLDED